MQRVQAVIKTVEPHDSTERYTELGVEVVQGRAKIVSPWEVDITAEDGSVRRLSTRSIVIATGARPFVPPIPGIETIGYLTSDTVWNLRELPQRLVVLGGGPIGAELTQAFARLGATVTQVELGPRLLPREDPEVSELVMARFRHEGIDVRVNHLAKACVIEQGEKILIAEHAGQEVRLPFDGLLIAVGRAARLDGFGLEELGIPTEAGGTVGSARKSPVKRRSTERDGAAKPERSRQRSTTRRRTRGGQPVTGHPAPGGESVAMEETPSESPASTTGNARRRRRRRKPANAATPAS